MNKELIDKYWKDPVWSKIIAASIIGFASLIWLAFEVFIKKIPVTELLDALKIIIPDFSKNLILPLFESYVFCLFAFSKLHIS